MTYSVLLVGCGRIAVGQLADSSASTHLGAILSNPNLRLKGVVDIDPLKAASISLLTGSKAFPSLEAALLHNYDVVSVCTPDHTHFEIVKSCLLSPNRPKLIFSEKPLCQNRSQLSRLQNLLCSYPVPLLVNHTRRFSQRHRLLRELIHTERLGAPVSINATYYGGFIHNGIHAVDTIAFLFSSRIVWTSVSARIPSRFPDDPCLNLTGTLAGSAIPITLSSVDETFYQIFEFDFRLSAGRVIIEDFGDAIRVFERFTNVDSENVLRSIELLPSHEISPLAVAYSEIVTLLDSPTSTQQSLSLISNVAPSYDMMWQAFVL